MSPVRLLPLLLLLASCTASGNSDLTSPLVAILFPPPNGVTEAATIVVTGTASDPNGIDFVRVGSTDATSTDGFATWQATVNLAPGENQFTVVASDGVANLEVFVITIERIDVVPAAPAAVAPDLGAGRVLVLDTALRALFFVELASGGRTLLPGGAGPELAAPSDVALDLAGGRALVVDGLLRALLAVDLATGARTVLSDDATGMGDDFASPRAVVLDGARAFVADGFPNEVFRVDLATGDRTPLTGGLAEVPNDVAFDTLAGRVLVLTAESLVAVDPEAGGRSVLADMGTGTGPPLTNATGLAFDAAANRVLVTDSALGAVLSIDPATGDRAVVSDASTGSGPAFGFPQELVLDGARALVVDSILDAIVDVDRASGDRTTIGAVSIGAGPRLVSPRDVVVDGDRVLVVDSGLGLVEIDLLDGDRAEITGTGDPFVTPLGLSTRTNGSLFVADTGARAVFDVDLATGDRTVFANGGAFGPTDVAIAGDAALVTDGNAGELLSILLATGARDPFPDALNLPPSVLADAPNDRAWVLSADTDPLRRFDLASRTAAVIDVPELLDPRGLAFDGTRLFVADDGLNAVVRVALPGGAATELGGNGPPLLAPAGIAFDQARGVLYVVDAARGALLAVDPSTGERALVSQ